MSGTASRAGAPKVPRRPKPVAGAGAPGPQACDVPWDVLFEKINDLVVVADAGGTIFYASPAARVLGYEPQELIGRKGEDFVHPEDLEHLRANTMALFNDAAVDPKAVREHRFRLKDGSWIWLEGNPSLFYGPHGAPVALVNVFRNITEKRMALDALEASERRYRLLADHATDVISQAASNGRMIYISPSAERMTGYSIAELLPRQMREFVHPEDLPGFLTAYRDLVGGRAEGGRPICYRFRHKDGAWIWLESNPRLVRSTTMGRPHDIIDVTREVTEQQMLKLELRGALAEAEKLTTVKSEFLANMSHEIRTPLTAVLGFASLLAGRADLDPDATQYAERIAAAGRSLLAIVNDVLDFSKLEAGLVTLAPRPAAAAALAQEVLEMFSLQAAGKGLKLRFAADPDIPPFVSLDADRLRQILINLVGNAVKFTDAGSVALKVRYDRRRARFVADVTDTGPGISADAREKLFLRFSQVDGSSTRTKGGTGLGLAICHGLAQAMGGSVSVRSRLGRGSTFSVSVSAPPVAAAPPLSEASVDGYSDLEGLRVLVVDDNASNRQLARAVLEGAGIDVSEARDGAEAVAEADRLPVDLILMDMRMPGLDGRGAAAAIRGGEGPNRDVPILGFSAESESASACPDRASLFAGWVGKPLSPQLLLEALRRAILDGPEERTADARRQRLD